MRRTSIATLIFMMLVCLSISFASSKVSQAQSAEKGRVINEICPVMGGKVDKDTPYTAEYKGKTIGFCCPSCVTAFNAEPEKYMAKLKKEHMKECVIKCPECGAEIDVMKQCKEGKMGGTCPMM